MKALVTFATGDFDELLDIAWPGFRSYADRHGYDLLDAPPSLLLRPASWGKVLLLLSALDAGYDEVLWIDCDCVIVDDSRDVADEVDPDAWTAIAKHASRAGEIPSAGLWFVRPAMRRWLEALWRLDRYLHHPWWEQGALHQLLGYGDREPIERVAESDLYDHTHWLPPDWHAIWTEVPGVVWYPDGEEPEHPRVVHCCPGSRVEVRAALMRDLVARPSPALRGAP